MSDVYPFYRRAPVDKARTRSRIGKITIELREDETDPVTLARPTSMHGAAVQMKLHSHEWLDMGLGIFVDGQPATTEQKDLVEGNLRPFLDLT